jgi:murein DD-endopeptidase MepM/ murein hydrolase activator NlpD
MPEERSRIPEWAESIRSALPKEGTIKLLIAGRPGVRYVELSRTEIEESAREARARQRRRRHRARQIVARRRQQLSRVTLATATVLGGLVVGLAGIWMDRMGTERLLQAERSEFQERDQAFQAYAEATRHLLSSDNEGILSELSALRFDLSTPFSTPTRSRLAGGTGDESPVLSALQTRLDPTQQELLLQNLELRDFLQNLPSVDPLVGMRLVSGFGLRRHPIFRSMQHHAGLDFVTDGDPTIRASQSGVVTHSGPNGGYGLTVEITSDFGVVTRYAHLRRIHVARGERLEAGSPLGIMGSTGLSTGPHLHYEVIVNGVAVDPSKVFALSRNALEQTVEVTASR